MAGLQHSGDQFNVSTHLKSHNRQFQMISRRQDTEQDISTPETRCHKPIREAAIQARQRVRDWTSELTDSL